MWVGLVVSACDGVAFTEQHSELQGTSLHLLDTAGNERPSFEAGESVLVSVDKLAPVHGYRAVVRDAAEAEVLSLAMVTDREGSIASTLLWPDLGFGSAPQGYFSNDTLAGAHAEMAGRSFTVELWDKQTVVTKTTFAVAKSMDATRLFASTNEGEPQRAFRDDTDELWVTGRNFPAGATLDVILVARRYDWRVGDPVDSVEDPDTGPVVRRIQLDPKATGFTELLSKAARLAVGHYQLIARPVSENQDLESRSLDTADVVSDRIVSTFTINPSDLCVYAPIRCAIITTTEIAGQPLIGPPYFQIQNNFRRGTDVWAALDPAALPPEAVGRKVRYYVIRHKTAAEWAGSLDLVDVTGNIVEAITRADSIGTNRTLVWPNAQPGRYDLVIDFGNNARDPAAFIADARLDAARDQIDGYLRVGFTVTDDATAPGLFAVGRTTYSEPAVTLTSFGETFDLPLIANVRYPAEAPGDDVPVSATRPRYPVVVVAHGAARLPENIYTGFNYLLDHLASHGYIAVSVDCGSCRLFIGSPVPFRARAILAHLDVLARRNADPGLLHGKLDLSRIALVGHSQGGDGVVAAELFNQTEALGWSIDAVISVAPTDITGPSPTPRTLRSSKYLVLYGSNDGDVGQLAGFPFATGGVGTGFRHYDRAHVEKAMVLIRDANHNAFNTTTPSEWATHPAVVIPETQQRAVLQGYVTAFLQWHVEGRTEQRDYFTDLPLVEAGDPRVFRLAVQRQYRAPVGGNLVIDDFEARTPMRNSLGGDVATADVNDHRVDALGALDRSSPHQTTGARLRWTASSASYRTAIPGAFQDLSAFGSLSFRVGQTYGFMGTVFDTAPSFSVELDRRELSSELRTRFIAATGQTLTDSARVVVVALGSRWRIDDGENQFDLDRTHMLAPRYGFDTFLLEVRRAGAGLNQVGASQDFVIRLTSADGRSRAIRAGYFATIPYPQRPVSEPGAAPLDEMRTLAAMQTIQIPLASWEVAYPGAETVDLRSVTEISFEFSVRPRGELVFDDLEITP